MKINVTNLHQSTVCNRRNRSVQNLILPTSKLFIFSFKFNELWCPSFCFSTWKNKVTSSKEKRFSMPQPEGLIRLGAWNWNRSMSLRRVQRTSSSKVLFSLVEETNSFEGEISLLIKVFRGSLLSPDSFVHRAGYYAPVPNNDISTAVII